MNVLFVSQCAKKALPDTRRVLDQFAERCGDRTWQTAITDLGLQTLRKMLKKTARRNTSVACHWIKGRNRTELLWIVGNTRKFNAQGSVPTNTTRRDMLRQQDENAWQTAEDIALLSGIAALFHDFGKANTLFQNKINPAKSNKKRFEPYRHEWVSLRMFEAFVKASGDSGCDQHWLNALSQIKPQDDTKLFKLLVKDNPDTKVPSPFIALPPVARAVAWLVLTHHRLPVPTSKQKGEKAVLVSQSAGHLDKRLSPIWNSPQIDQLWTATELKHVWQFAKGSPLCSRTWCAKARRIGQRALRRQHFWQPEKPWLEETFTLHLARLSLMLADHDYSAQDANESNHDSQYRIFANSDRETGTLKQTLDDHLIGVYRGALRFVRTMPVLKPSLPSVTDIRALKKRNVLARFRWQDNAFELTRSLAEESRQKGFFAVNMASTGRGKTLANARIMYALSDKRDGCRFTVALGLRTLTLQTGDALRKRLSLAEEDIAVMIGSQAVQELHKLAHEASKEALLGSESLDAFDEDSHYVQYDGAVPEGPLKRWLAGKPRQQKLVHAPILVSTIDHLTPATEAARGGKQIAPMLRLLTSDLVLDEPDDFDVDDLPALIRLVNWAGLLGSRVLLSSATLAPDIVEALFVAYRDGRQQFNRAMGKTRNSEVCCAWYDENKAHSASCGTQARFSQAHREFVTGRVKKLSEQAVIQRASIAPITTTSISPADVIDEMSRVVLDNLYQLHQLHGQVPSEILKNKRISFGMVRMANIKPLVALAQCLAKIPARVNTCLHVCVYHSQYPLIVRSEMENTLDSVFNRTDEQAVWQHPAVLEALKNNDAENHVFVVLGTSVMEVGRDWDLDWAIAEPSSMRALIQLAGRVQRHRRRECDHHNVVMLGSNYKALTHPREPAFTRPGFETRDLRLKSHILSDILKSEQYQTINAIPRIQKRQDNQWQHNLADLEHHHLYLALFDEAQKAGAHNWWHQPCHWTYLMQQKTPFRQSVPSHDYWFRLDDEDEDISIWRWHQNGEAKPANAEFTPEPVSFAQGVNPWLVKPLRELLENKAEETARTLTDTSKTFGAIHLRRLEKSSDGWCYSPEFGVYQALVQELKTGD